VFAIPGLTLAGFAVHLAGLIARGVEGERFPLKDLREVLYLLAWVAVSVYLLAHFKLRMEIVGVVILPLVVCLMLVTVLIPQGSQEITDGIRGSARLIHIIPAIVGVSALFLTFSASVIYLIQERALKNHHPMKFFLKLPSLETCERLGHQSLTWGFALLTFVVITGVVSVGARPDTDWELVWHEKWALIAWLIFAVVVYDRIFEGGWRGKKAAYFSILGFAAMILRMLGI
jgi:ABC-type uncharacterized transport system permease subunit